MPTLSGEGALKTQRFAIDRDDYWGFEVTAFAEQLTDIEQRGYSRPGLPSRPRVILV